MLEVIKNRRTIRTWNDTPVEETKILEIIRAGMEAPSSKDSRPWEFVIVDDKNILEQLSKAHHGAKHIKNAPICIVVFGNRERFFKAGKWIQDLATCTQNMLLEVVNQGLGGCWVGIFPKLYLVNYVKETLNAPENLVPYVMIPIGYSGIENKFVDKFEEEKIYKNKFE